MTASTVWISKGYKAIAVTMGALTLASMMLVPPASVRRCIDQAASYGGMRASIPNTVIYSVIKGALWPASFAWEVLVDGRTPTDWLFTRYDPWAGDCRR